MPDGACTSWCILAAARYRIVEFCSGKFTDQAGKVIVIELFYSDGELR